MITIKFKNYIIREPNIKDASKIFNSWANDDMVFYI